MRGHEGEGLETQEDPRIAIGEQQGNTRNIIFQLQKKNAGTILLFFLSVKSSQPRQRFQQLQQQEGRLLEVVMGVGEKESSQELFSPQTSAQQAVGLNELTFS